MTQTLEEWRKAEGDLSAAYLRLRAMIPGAYRTPHAPTHEQVWATTENALAEMVKDLHSAREDVKKLEDAIVKMTRDMNNVLNEIRFP